MIFIKILVLLIPYASAVLGIQVYENITNDVTTSPTKLVIVPTPITKRDEPVTTSPHILNSNATSSTSTKDRNTMNSSVTPTSHEKSSRKKEKGNNEEGRK
ncbi:hypothetical protein Bhyg_14336 [Pseudolycoriella hygida]|uniref:Secreted protein n=1 Tax=Pseudolycoriella hygida TaxID=35572 RepID=A0A9Q0MPM8_9DIPT|nr:hypothetical protein Bhyg_14336 [Pseudolycoriella hygida]